MFEEEKEWKKVPIINFNQTLQTFVETFLIKS
jgi:hypothetical protein